MYTIFLLLLIILGYYANIIIFLVKINLMYRITNNSNKNKI